MICVGDMGVLLVCVAVVTVWGDIIAVFVDSITVVELDGTCVGCC